MQTLDVAIGLVFVYLMLSLVCTAANELLAQWLNSRATTLRSGIDALLRNAEKPIDLATEARDVTNTASARDAIEREIQRVAPDAYATWSAAARAAEDASLIVDQVSSRQRASERGVPELAGLPGVADAQLPELDAERSDSALGIARTRLMGATAARDSAAQALDAIRPAATMQLLAARDAAARARALHALATFYDHPLIAGLSELRWSRLPWQGKVRLPSYIPTAAFTVAIIDVIAPESTSSATPMLEVRRALAYLPEHARRPLLLVLNQSRGDIEKFRASLASWFDNTMERVSGLYKRKTKASVLLLAMGVTLFTNADTVKIVRALSSNKALRDALVAQAEATVKSPEGVKRRMFRDSTSDTTALKNEIAKSIAEIQSVGIPIGYTVPDSFAARLDSASLFSEHTIGEGVTQHILPSKLQLYLAVYLPQVLSGLVGLLLTTLALSLGAPFWFDILNKIVNVRAVGRTPAENAKVAAK